MSPTELKSKFIKFAKEQIKLGLIKKFKIEEEDEILINLYRKNDDIKVTLLVTPGGAFCYYFDGILGHCYTGNNEVEQKEALENLLFSGKKLLLEKDFHREVYEKKDHIIYKSIVFSDGTIFNSSLWLVGFVRKFFGYKKRVIS